jgi:hypothetical protein
VPNEITVVVENSIEVDVEVAPKVYEVNISGLGEQGPRGDQGVPGVAAPSLNPLTFSRRGQQYVEVGDQKFYVDHHGTDLGVRVTLAEPPVGADFIVGLRQNNVIIGHATILDGQTTSGYIALVPGTVDPGDYFTIDVEQVGAVDPGYTLGVTLWMRVTP